MTRQNRFLTFLLVGVAAACGDASAPKPAPSVPAPAPAAPETPPPATKPPAPEPAPAAPQPAPAPAPAAHATKDAKGHDWASHMGDIAFTFDSGEAATRAKKEGRVAMMYFTSPT